MTRYPTNENINFAKLPFDLGVIHYASDTPYTRGKNLGAGSLSYYGMDSTYAATIAILRRILEQELGGAVAAHPGTGGGDAVARAEALKMRRAGSEGRQSQHRPLGTLEFRPGAPAAARCLPARRPAYHESR